MVRRRRARLRSRWMFVSQRFVTIMFHLHLVELLVLSIRRRLERVVGSTDLLPFALSRSFLSATSVPARAGN
jgi:hypothetical protein